MQIVFEKYIGDLNAELIFAKFVTLIQSGLILKDVGYWTNFKITLLVLFTTV